MCGKTNERDRGITPLVGSIEAGGTKFVCAIGTGPDDLRNELRFPTGEPAETLSKVVSYFKEQERQHGKLAALGIGCFGPVDLESGSKTYGFITSTPKKSWQHTDLLGAMRHEFKIPIGFDTDVNSAALAEHRWGAAQGLDTFVYLTIGTGIGGGGMARGRLLHGLVHPEMGHMKLPHDSVIDPYPGCCPFHGDCWEGLASGSAMAERWGRAAETLPENHPAWELEADYLAKGLVNLVCVISPQRIILGGGVMKQRHVFNKIRTRFIEQLKDYLPSPIITKSVDDYIVAPALADRAGVAGGIALALKFLQEEFPP